MDTQKGNKVAKMLDEYIKKHYEWKRELPEVLTLSNAQYRDLMDWVKKEHGWTELSQWNGIPIRRLTE